MLKGPYEFAFGTLSKREDPLDKIDNACRKEPF